MGGPWASLDLPFFAFLHTHTEMLMLAGGNQTNLATRLFPAPVSFCGVGFLAELGWRSRAGLVQSPQIN